MFLAPIFTFPSVIIAKAQGKASKGIINHVVKTSAVRRHSDSTMNCAPPVGQMLQLRTLEGGRVQHDFFSISAPHNGRSSLLLISQGIRVSRDLSPTTECRVTFTYTASSTDQVLMRKADYSQWFQSQTWTKEVC